MKLNSPAAEQLAKALEAQEAAIKQEVKVEEPAQTAPEVVPAKSETPSEPITPVEPVVVTEPEEWDEPVPQVAVPSTTTIPDFDYLELGKSTGLGEIKTKDELVSKVKELQTKALDGVPDNLKKAIELAKQGGDYLSYLKVSQVDYNAYDPVELFKTDLYNRVKTLNPQATKEELETRFQDALGTYAPIQQLIEGQKIQKSYSDVQRQEALRLEQESLQRKSQADTRVKESIDKLDDVNGFKVKPHHKAAMYEYITSGQLQKDLFSESGYNYEALVEIAFQRKYGKKANEFLWNKAKTASKKEIVQELTNPQIEKPTSPLQTEVKEVSAMKSWLEQLRSRHTKPL